MSAGGTGGVMPSPASDTCPGDLILLQAGDTLSWVATLEGAADDLFSFCGDTTADADRPEVVYTFALMSEGILDIHVTPLSPGLDAAFYLRKECGVTGGPDELCFDEKPGPDTVRLAFAAGTYSVIVDTAAGNPGAFEVTASLTAPMCGDGTVSGGEQCDPGAGIAGDGCGDPAAPDACQFQIPPADADDCPGEEVLVPAGTTMLLAANGYSTYGYADDHNSKVGGGCPHTPGGRDRVFRLVPASNGALTVKMGYEPDGETHSCDADLWGAGCWDMKIYARTECADPASELECSDIRTITPESVQLDVTAGVPYYVFVDGYDGSSWSTGPLNLKVSLMEVGQ